MKNLRPTGKKNDDELHEPEGLEVHISHEHLAKLLDNGSSDGTLDIIRSLANEGIPITIYQTV